MSNATSVKARDPQLMMMMSSFKGVKVVKAKRVYSGRVYGKVTQGFSFKSLSDLVKCVKE